jgi:hypothetical protein
MPTDLAAVLGISGTDLAANCTSSAINMWAKCKPEGVASGLQAMPVGILTNAMRALNGYGIRTLYQNGYGSLSGLVSDLRNNSVRAMFEYIKPSGGINSPYRLADFNGYYHGARTPIWSPYNPTDTLRVNGDGTLQLYFYTSVNGSEMELGLKDLRFSSDNHTFADYYFGILIYDNSSYYAATQNHVMGSSWQEGLDVTLTGVPVPSGSNIYTYQMVPFFATQPISSQSTSFVGTIFPMTFAKTEIKVGSAASLISISTWVYVWSNDMSTLRLKWNVGNRTSAAFTFATNISNSYVTVGNPQQQGTYGYWGININESIPAESSRNGDVVIATNLLSAQQDFIRNGDSYVQINANRPNAPYFYSDIVQVWEPD